MKDENKGDCSCQCSFVYGISELANQGIIACEKDFSIVFFNKGASRILGFSEEEALEMTLGMMFTRETMDSCESALLGINPPGGVVVLANPQSLLQAICKDGSEVPLSISVSSVEQQSRPLYTLTFTDESSNLQTERQLKSFLVEKDLLLKEVHHRVKNNLQVISSLLNLQSRHASDSLAVGVIRESQNRIKAIALIYELLYQSSVVPKLDFGKYIEKLSGSLLRAYAASGRVEVVFELESVELAVDDAVPAGLVVNELISNCIQHAYPEPHSGIVRVRLTESPGALFFLRISDCGRGFDDLNIFDKVSTLGARLVASLVKQLEGTLRVFNEDGAVVEIRCRESRHGR